MIQMLVSNVIISAEDTVCSCAPDSLSGDLMML